MSAGTAPELSYEIELAASPAAVFEHWTDPAKLVTWMGKVATLEPVPGGVFRLEYGNGEVASGRYVDAELSTRLVFTWGWEGDASFPPGSSTIALTFGPRPDGGTLMRLRHAGVPTDLRSNVDEGWAYFLPRLVAAAEAAEA